MNIQNGPKDIREKSYPVSKISKRGSGRKSEIDEKISFRKTRPNRGEGSRRSSPGSRWFRRK